MYNRTITLFNFHKPTGAWYTSVFTHVDLIESNANRATQKGEINGDTVEAIIHIKQDQSANTIIYEPYRITDAQGNVLIADDHNKISYKEPDTDKVKRYIGPKAYEKLENPADFFTFRSETDFFVVGNYASSEPVLDDDFDEGLYHAMNEVQDNVYLVSSATFFSLIPHFEIGGR